MLYSKYRSYLIGKKVYAKRLGKAPINGISYNYRDNIAEQGVSMMSISGCPDNGASIIDDRKKYYYIGVVIGFGSDDEPVMSNCTQVTYSVYVNNKNKELASIIKKDEKITAKMIEKGYSPYNWINHWDDIPVFYKQKGNGFPDKYKNIIVDQYENILEEVNRI